jgi:hypothetical protein
MACQRRERKPRHGEFPPKNRLLGDIVVAGPGDHCREDLVYHLVYRDNSRIRL